MSEYDPLIRRDEEVPWEDLEEVQGHFSAASRAYLSSPIPWLVWAIVLPGAALATRAVASGGGAYAVLALWSVAVMIGGVVEGTIIVRRRRSAVTALGGWVMRAQGNQSLVGLAISLLLIWRDLASALPGLWLLLIGHSFFLIGGLAFRPMRRAGIIYQLGGLVALWPGDHSLPVFAAATAAGNLTMALALLRRPTRQGRSRLR